MESWLIIQIVENYADTITEFNIFSASFILLIFEDLYMHTNSLKNRNLKITIYVKSRIWTFVVLCILLLLVFSSSSIFIFYFFISLFLFFTWFILWVMGKMCKRKKKWKDEKGSWLFWLLLYIIIYVVCSLW